jgi:hypothetical protein
MTIVDSLRRALRMQPFRPFGVKLVDGTVYTVSHPDWISIPPVERPREVTFYQVMNEGRKYQTHWIDLSLILEVISPVTTEAAPTRMEGKGA